mmetsp:Transcript_27405/g.49418  ORF Transcript_27405/g.49418 Transcript_27405/m.49418 type:complete len:376 (-) Transcript_27405:49-1176(-)
MWMYLHHQHSRRMLGLRLRRAMGQVNIGADPVLLRHHLTNGGPKFITCPPPPRRMHSTGPATEPPKEGVQWQGRWSKFASNWNTTLARRPQEAMATYLAAQSSTWLTLYTALSLSGAALLFPPELAAGWMVARLTKKLRQPANIALAAVAVRYVPALSEVKVSPLVTGFVADKKTREVWHAKRMEMEKNLPAVRPVMDGISKGAAYLQGPVDKYGLSLFFSGKVSSIGTIGISTALISNGVDLQSILAEWGIDGGLGDVAGTLAGAAVLNAFLTPVHFLACVHGNEYLEKAARTLAPIVDGMDDDRGNGKRKANGGGEGNTEDSILKVVGLLLLLYSFGISMYALKTIGKKAVDGNEDGAGEEEKTGAKSIIQTE